MAILPAMRAPKDVSWHKDLVYNTMWKFLVELERWNNAHQSGEDNTIRTVLMTGSRGQEIGAADGVGSKQSQESLMWDGTASKSEMRRFDRLKIAR
jgi:hypothetical protein